MLCWRIRPDPGSSPRSAVHTLSFAFCGYQHTHTHLSLLPTQLTTHTFNSHILSHTEPSHSKSERERDSAGDTDHDRAVLATQYEHYARLFDAASQSHSSAAPHSAATQAGGSKGVRITSSKSAPSLTFPCPSSSHKLLTQHRKQASKNNNGSTAAPPLPLIDSGTQFIINRCYNSLAQHRRNDRLVRPILSHLRDYLLRSANKKSITLYLSYLAGEIADKQRAREKRAQEKEKNLHKHDSTGTNNNTNNNNNNNSAQKKAQKKKKAECSPTMDEEVMAKALKRFIKQFALFPTSSRHSLAATEPGCDDCEEAAQTHTHSLSQSQSQKDCVS